MWSIQCKCHYINTTQLTDTIDWSLRFPFSFAFAFAFSFNFGFCANIFQFRWKSIFIATKVVNISVEFVAIPSRGNVEQDYSCVLASHDSTFDDVSVCVLFFHYIYELFVLQVLQYSLNKVAYAFEKNKAIFLLLRCIRTRKKKQTISKL